MLPNYSHEPRTQPNVSKKNKMTVLLGYLTSCEIQFHGQPLECPLTTTIAHWITKIYAKYCLLHRWYFCVKPHISPLVMLNFSNMTAVC